MYPSICHGLFVSQFAARLSYFAILCAEISPFTESGLAASLKDSESLSLGPGTFFGPALLYSNGAACAAWPGRAKTVYRGPWDKKTNSPILVIGNQFDGPTPLADAVAVAVDLLDNAR